MTLIRSISGIRGTIGGEAGEGLSPIDVARFTCAFGEFLRKNASSESIKVVIGRDARPSGEMVKNIVVGSLQGMGINVIDLGLSTTPTVEIAVEEENATGGLILTASHNPVQWNALKLLNNKGEFLSGKDGKEVLDIAEKNALNFAEVENIGHYRLDDTYLQKHIDMVLELDLVEIDTIREKGLKVVCDCVNSSGGLFIPVLLRALGVKDIVKLYCEPTGQFPHNPEPLPEHLTTLSETVRQEKADLGLVVDPDTDRLAFVDENGAMFGEEYTLVAVADHVLQHKKGNTVSNLSSTRSLRDITEKQGGTYHASAVGEVNVVEKMKAVDAVIGGEGNGGVIYPPAHYGRDALVGVGLFITHLAKSGKTCSELRKQYPDYTIVKNKVELTPDLDVDQLLKEIQEKYKEYPINTEDGVKIEFDEEWVHLRKSNTEPIIRVYAESKTEEKANKLASGIMEAIKDIAGTKV